MTAPSPWIRPGPWAMWRRIRSRDREYARLVGVAPDVVHGAWDEIQSDRWLFDHLLRVEERFRGSNEPGFGASVRGHNWAERWITGHRFSLPNAELYSLVRALAPLRVVETGVASGISTALILRALDRNGGGTLTSVDLPIRDARGSINADGVRDTTHIPPHERPGWGVPEELRGRWTLLEGDTRVRLPEALVGDPPTFFFHDSEHSFEVMDFEYRAAWSVLRSGGVLYSDDVFWNAAFPSFARTLGVDPMAAVTPAGRGLLRKPVGPAPASASRK